MTGTITSQSVVPSTDSTYNLGADGTAFANAYVDTVDATTIKSDGISITQNNVSGTRSNEDINISPSGTGAVVVDGLRVAGTEISSDDSSQVTIRDGLTITGAVVMMNNLPTSDPNNAGQLWNDSGTLKISAG